MHRAGRSYCRRGVTGDDAALAVGIATGRRRGGAAGWVSACGEQSGGRENPGSSGHTRHPPSSRWLLHARDRRTVTELRRPIDTKPILLKLCFQAGTTTIP